MQPTQARDVFSITSVLIIPPITHFMFYSRTEIPNSLHCPWCSITQIVFYVTCADQPNPLTMLMSWTIFHSIPLPLNPIQLSFHPSQTFHQCFHHFQTLHYFVAPSLVIPSFCCHYSSLSVSVITVFRYFGSLPPLLSSKHHSRICGWMITSYDFVLSNLVLLSSVPVYLRISVYRELLCYSKTPVCNRLKPIHPCFVLRHPHCLPSPWN